VIVTQQASLESYFAKCLERRSEAHSPLLKSR
jgi:hypothetical protein